VDPLVDRQLKRDGSADVLVTLDGASTLSSARAEAHGSSRALLRRTEPVYRALKAGLHLRVPGLSVLEDYRPMPVQLLRVRSPQELARLKADPSVVGIGADRVDSLDLTQSLPLIDQPEAAAADHTGSGTAVAVLDSGVDYGRSAFGSCSAPGTPGCKVVVAQDFAPDDGMRDDPTAGFHGTNVAAIVVGVASLTCTIQGTSGPDVLAGRPGNVICGGGGGDVLVPIGGIDTIDGGNGFDFVSLEDASGGGTVDLNAGTASAPGIAVSIQRIEDVIGTPFNDTLIGNAADNDFLGLGGDDAIDGGGGFDFVRYDFAIVNVEANLRRSTARGEGTDALTALEGVVGGAKDDNLTGDGTANILVGLNGGDRLSGLGRPDTLIGGPGADDLFGGAATTA
jgi:Ca2+-binding RTX toxin-like protein